MFLKPIKKYSLVDDFSNMVDNFFSDSFMPFKFDSFKIDVRENDNEYIVEAELPGLQKEDIKCEYKDNYLKIEVKHEETVNEEKENYIHKERKLSAMNRCVYLEDIKEDGISAKLENGILTIKAQKVEKPNNTFSIDIE